MKLRLRLTNLRMTDWPPSRFTSELNVVLRKFLKQFTRLQDVHLNISLKQHTTNILTVL